MCAKGSQFSSLVQKRKINVRSSSRLDLLLPAQGISLLCSRTKGRRGRSRGGVGRECLFLCFYNTSTIQGADPDTIFYSLHKRDFIFNYHFFTSNHLAFLAPLPI